MAGQGWSTKWLLPCALAAGVLAQARGAWAERTLDEYKYFRALSIDLVGRVPTEAELAAFEDPGFDLDGWIDAHTDGTTNPAYAERIRRIYTDLMRLQIGTSFQFETQFRLDREPVLIDDGTPSGRLVWVYYRRGQRRHDPRDTTPMNDTDGDFCLLPAETGASIDQQGVERPYPPSSDPMTPPTLHPVPMDVFNRYVVAVHPWWLYRDYASASPHDRYDPTTWAARFPNFAPDHALLFEPNPDGTVGTTPTTVVYACREETQGAATGTPLITHRAAITVPAPNGRIVAYPRDSSWATANHTASVDCTTQLGYQTSAQCGCGAALERCLPGTSAGFSPNAFVFPQQNALPLGTEQPVDQVSQQNASWWRLWWGQEAVHFLDYVFANDRDFRELLTARYGFVNGPLAQFYRAVAGTSCCTVSDAAVFHYTAPPPLFDPSHLPPESMLAPQDTATWMKVDDRGPHASGLLTMPVFLTKYGSRRARAHILYNAFLCRDFVATSNLALTTSTDPNLMTRPGCANCHATL